MTSLGRREAVLALGAFGVAASGLTKAAPASAQGNRVLRVTETTIGEADPHKPTDIPGSILMFNIYDFLVRPEAGRMVPTIAESWTISADATSYTFKLKPGITFHDGTPLTAEDVVFSFKRMQALKRGFSYLFESVKDAAASDPSTVVFTLSMPYAPFLASLCRLAVLNSRLVIANKKDGPHPEFGDYGQAFLSSADAGSGPYVIARHEPQQETMMRRFDKYVGGHAPTAPDTVRMRFGIEAATVRTLMSRKEIDLTRPPMPPEILAALSKQKGISLLQDRGAQQFQIKLNMQRGPTRNLEFRRALALGFDYASLNRLLDIGGVQSGTPARGPIPVGVMGHDPAVPAPQRDVAAAKAALAASGIPEAERDIEMMWPRESPQMEKFALLFQAGMAEIGIRVTLQPTPWAQYQQRVSTPETTPHANCIYVGLTTPDIDSLFWATYHSSSPATFNNSHWLKNDAVDKTLQEGRVMIEPDARAELYRKLAATLREIQPALFVYDHANVVARQDYVTAPTLEDASQALPIFGGNYQFRTMGMQG